MKNVYKLMLLVAVILVSVTANAHKKSIYKIAPQMTTSQRMMKKAKPAKSKKAIARQFSQMSAPNGRMAKAAPTAKKATVNITATNLETVDFSVLFDDFAYYIGASNDTYEVCLWLNTTTFAGTYTTTKLDRENSYIAYGENYSFIASLNITATEVQGVKTVTGIAVCEDGNVYNLNLSYVKPTKTSTESITITDAELADETAVEGFFEAAGLNATGSRYVAVCVYSNQVAGTYTIDDCDTYFTYVAKLGKDTVYYDLVDADLKVTMVDANTAKITGTLLCQSEADANDVPEFTISMTCAIESGSGGSSEGLDYDAENDDFSATFTSDDDVIVDDSYFNDYNVLYIDATTADGKKAIGLEFNVSEKDKQIVIPAGVYTITSGYGEGTVTASEGVDEDGYITYSFAGTLDEDGYFEDPMWFLVGGTVTVTNDNGKLKVVVDAVNSNGCEVTSTITTGVSVTPDPIPGENLVQNGSFETWTSDSQPTGWEGWQITEYGNSGGAVLSKTTDSVEGTYACYIAGDTKNKRLSTGKLSLKAGKYYVQFYAKAADGEGAIKPGYATKQANGDAAYTYIYGDDCISLSSSWVKITYDFTLASNTDIAMVIMNYKNSGDCIIDDYKLWLDGSEPVDTIDPKPVTDKIYSIDFTQGMESWTIEDKSLGEGLEYVWKQDGKFGMKASAFVNKVNIPAESWIVSPEIDLTGVTKATMTMNHAVNFTTTPTKYLSVKVSTDKKTWDNIEVSPWPAGNSWDYNEASATLDKYAGKKIYVAFVYTSDSNAAPTWEIDKFEVAGENQDVPPTPITTEIYSIDYTKGMDPWVIDNKSLAEGLEYVWKQDSKYGMKASAFVNKTNMPSESWLISPEIDLTGVATARMQINHAVNFTTTPTKYLSVKVSTDKQTWDNIEVTPWPAGNSWDYNKAAAILDKYAGKKIYVAFVYTSDSNAAPTWEIDMFQVTGEAGSKVLRGDADVDGVVTVADITAIAAYILGSEPASFNTENADANADGNIDVADITTTAGIILGK